MKPYMFLVKPRNIINSLLMPIAFLCAACEDGCRRANVETLQDKNPLVINIEDLKVTYCVNSNPVADIEGSIQRNDVKATMGAYAVMVPETEDIKKAIDSFMQNSKSATASYMILPNGLGGVYFLQEIKPLQKGKIQANVCLEGLNPGKYNVYLMTYEPAFGAFYSQGSKGIEIFNKDPNPPSIQMNDVRLARGFNLGEPCIEVTLTATAANINKAMQGYFLFIKKKPGKKNESPKDLFTKYGIPTSAGLFTKVWGNEAIICPFSVNPHETKKEFQGQDKDHFLEPGATYVVYGYLVDHNHSNMNVLLSPNHIELVIPKNIVELTMVKAEIIALWKCLNVPLPDSFKDIDRMAISFEMEITKHVSVAHATQLGYFVSLKQVDIETRIAAIKKLLKGSPNFKDKQVAVYGSPQEFLYIVDHPGLQTNQIGRFKGEVKISGVPFELGAKYYVYALAIQDDLDVFVSNNSLEMQVPKVDLRVLEFETLKKIDRLLTISKGEVKVIASPVTNNNANQTTGYIIYPKEGLTLTDVDSKEIQGMAKAIKEVKGNLAKIVEKIIEHSQALAEEVENHKHKKKKATGAVLFVPNTFVAYLEDLPGNYDSGQEQMAKTSLDEFRGVPAGVKFGVAKVWCRGKYFFIQEADNFKVFTWYQIDQPEEPFVPIRDKSFKVTHLYRCDKNMKKYAELLEVSENGEVRKAVEYSKEKEGEIRKLLESNAFQGNPTRVKESVDAFIELMKKSAGYKTP